MSNIEVVITRGRLRNTNETTDANVPILEFLLTALMYPYGRDDLYRIPGPTWYHPVPYHRPIYWVNPLICMHIIIKAIHMILHDYTFL